MLATLPIPILVVLLAQAEPAPAEPAPADVQPGAETAPALVAEPAAQAEPAPEPEPRLRRLRRQQPEAEQGQAEPSDGEPNMMFGFRAGADFQFAGDISPKLGYSLSPFVQYTYARMANRLALGVRAEFTFDRFQKLVTVPADMGTDQPPLSYQTTRTLSFFDFALLATATLHLGWLRPWVAAGMGLALGNFQTPEAEYRPVGSHTTRPLALGAGGIDVAVGRGALVGLHVEYRNMLDKPSSVSPMARPLTFLATACQPRPASCISSDGDANDDESDSRCDSARCRSRCALASGRQAGLLARRAENRTGMY